MFQFHNSDLPSVFENIFTVNNEIHHYPTRQTNLFHLPRTRTALAQDTFIFTAPKYWNSLPIEIRNSNSLFILKRKLKKMLIVLYGN